MSADGLDLAYVPLAIFPGRQFENAHVCDGQPVAGTPGRDLDQSQVCHQSAQHARRDSEATVESLNSFSGLAPFLMEKNTSDLLAGRSR
jgi:hypothetical protein